MPVAPGRAKPFPCDLTSPVRDPRQVKRSLPLRRPAAPAVVAPASPPGAPASAGPEIARTVRETSKSAPTGHRKSLVIYERKTPGQASASEELAHSLRERFATELDVRIVDLDEVAVETEVPSQLRFRISVSETAACPRWP
jgi:hypothetical protein